MQNNMPISTDMVSRDMASSDPTRCYLAYSTLPEGMMLMLPLSRVCEQRANLGGYVATRIE